MDDLDQHSDEELQVGDVDRDSADIDSDLEVIGNKCPRGPSTSRGRGRGRSGGRGRGRGSGNEQPRKKKAKESTSSQRSSRANSLLGAPGQTS
jgi:hypothetical protein